jgi:hypothetical protein
MVNKIGSAQNYRDERAGRPLQGVVMSSSLKNIVRGAALAAVLVIAPTVSQAAVLLHEYTFGGASVIDSVGGQNGILVGGASVSGGVLNLDGTSGYVQFGAQLVPTGLTAFSVTLDAQQLSRTPGAFMELISQGQSGAPGFYIGHSTTGEVRIGDQFTATGVAFPNDNTNHSYAVTSDGSGTKFYLDGLLAFSSAVQINTPAFGTATRLGRQFDPFAELFHGNIDNLRIFSGALTDFEVANLSVTASLPAPGALALFAVGLAGLSLMRRRRKA